MLPEADLRLLNAKIAAAYDRLPFDSEPLPGVDPVWVFGLGALYGAAPANTAFDVLDLGCGTGVQLARLGQLTRGRLVGTDLSASACSNATARCAAFAERCRIVCSDILDLNESLGSFDLIYNIGVLYVTPPDVQRHLLKLIAACLKPKGVAVISYYAGTNPLVMAGLQPALRLIVNPGATPAEQVSTARGRLQEIIAGLSRQNGDHHFMIGVLQQVLARPDTTLFHEMLNHAFAAFSTSALETALAPHGVHFLNALAPQPAADATSPAERAFRADAADMGGGSYRYAVFGRCAADGGADASARNIAWHSALRPQGSHRFAEARGRAVTATSAALEATLNALAQKPLTWQALSAAVQATCNTAPPAELATDLLGLWQHGFLAPQWAPQGEL